MRIIDKNQDFYDYLQSPTDTIVFDRRGSFLLTKQMLCDRASMLVMLRRNADPRFLLLQCGAAFWLFLMKVTKEDPGFNRVLDYDLELLSKWKDYQTQRKPIGFQIIRFTSWHLSYSVGHKNVYDQIRKDVKKLQQACISGEYKVMRNLDTSEIYTDYKNSWTKKTLTIPLLKACGISTLLDPVEVFSAIEEYFSMEKTEAEKTEPEGATNDDKIIMHGFDTKTSFRGR